MLLIIVFTYISPSKYLSLKFIKYQSNEDIIQIKTNIIRFYLYILFSNNSFRSPLSSYYSNYFSSYISSQFSFYPFSSGKVSMFCWLELSSKLKLTLICLGGFKRVCSVSNLKIGSYSLTLLNLATNLKIFLTLSNYYFSYINLGDSGTMKERAIRIVFNIKQKI